MNQRLLTLPSLFTTLNLSFGVISIHSAIFGNLHLAAWFIIWAVLCDGMDGKLARWRHCETDFGVQLDSLADFVSFGVAPVVLFSTGVFKNGSLIALFLIIFYVYAGGYRLARFNVVQKGNRTEGYQGLPIPVSGMMLSGMWLFCNSFRTAPPFVVSLVLLGLLGLLMLSRIPYTWPRLMFGEGALKNLISCGFLLGTAAMALFPSLCIFPLVSMYVFWGVICKIHALIHKEWVVELFSKSNG